MESIAGHFFFFNRSNGCKLSGKFSSVRLTEAVVQELLTFVADVANNWAGYATGGLIVAFAWLYYARKEKTMPRAVALFFAKLFLVFAVFTAWRQQKHSFDLESLENGRLRKQLDSLTKSNFLGTIDWAVIGEQGNGAHVGLIVSSRNSGAPSAVEAASWR